MPILQTTTRDGQRLTLNVRRESTVAMENDNRSYTFDYEGRLVGAFRDGRNYRRSLDNRILEKQSGPRPGLSGRLRRMLNPDEVRALETEAYEFMRALPARLAQPLDPECAAALERINSYSYARLEREREIFQRLYRPVTILPPDQYLALYLQATEGCSYNECTFCGFYRDRRFHIKTPEEFQQHLADVRAFFGGGLTLRRTIFLGDANALMIPQPQLLALFERINAEFAILPRDLDRAARRAWQNEHPVHFDGIYSFVDAFTTRRKTAHDFAELAARGLRRVYLGLESGDPGLLKFLSKPNDPTDALHVVQQLKAGGVAVGVIVLVGAGGKEYQEAHIRATTDLINAMPLERSDLIYFSELVDYPGSTYAQHAAQAGITPLTADEMEAQLARLRAGLIFPDPTRAPQISFYDIREFVY